MPYFFFDYNRFKLLTVQQMVASYLLSERKYLHFSRCACPICCSGNFRLFL